MKPYFQDSHVTVFNSDVLAGLAALPNNSVHCVVTSPPYWGLRDYGVDGEAIGAQEVNALIALREAVKAWKDSLANDRSGQFQSEKMSEMFDRLREAGY